MDHLARILERKLTKMFADPKLRRDVARCLDDYGKDRPEPIRVKLAILKIAGQDSRAIEERVDGAKEDYRDIINWAEFPHKMQAGFSGRRLRAEEQIEIERLDWEQYHSWLDQ